MKYNSIEDKVILNNNINFCGTDEKSYLWCNSNHSYGIICSIIVNIVILSFISFIAYITFIRAISIINGVVMLILCILSVWCHWKTMFTDPGAVPKNAHPIPSDIKPNTPLNICAICNAYKPPRCHHDKISNRCISRMDHFCPWVNNAIGAKNQKNFLLFLIYTDISSVYIYLILSLHLVGCNLINCVEFNGFVLYIARSLVFILVFSIIFTSTVISYQLYGLSSGLGTLDRIQFKGNEERVPISIQDVFGIQWISYILPFNPVFENETVTLRYIVKNTSILSQA